MGVRRELQPVQTPAVSDHGIEQDLGGKRRVGRDAQPAFGIWFSLDVQVVEVGRGEEAKRACGEDLEAETNRDRTHWSEEISRHLMPRVIQQGRPAQSLRRKQTGAVGLRIEGGTQLDPDQVPIRRPGLGSAIPERCRMNSRNDRRTERRVRRCHSVPGQTGQQHARATRVRVCRVVKECADHRLPAADDPRPVAATLLKPWVRDDVRRQRLRRRGDDQHERRRRRREREALSADADNGTTTIPRWNSSASRRRQSNHCYKPYSRLRSAGRRG